jgi:hypothetical protein
VHLGDGPTQGYFRNDELLAACHLEKPLAMQGGPVCAPGGPAIRPARQRPLVALHDDDHHDHTHDHSH